ncbi:MAG: hypothetical protein LBJ20_04360 [Candidatus Methanoplasma sp.]|nr:hypothetical protein [Candidatus Methanoplasma sp.]
MIVPKYTDLKISDEHLSEMESRIHPYSDIVIVPRWDGITNNSTTLREDLWLLTSRYIEEVRILNGKMIMGNIPVNLPSTYIDWLVDKYLNDGVSSFLIDYNSRATRGQANIVRSISKKLEDAELYDESLLFSINMRKTHDIGGISPADDLLAFTNGLDILGNLHIGGGDGEDHGPKRVKAFNRTEYTYDTCVGVLESVAKEIKIANSIQKNEETAAIRHAISEKGTAYDLLKEKVGAQEYTANAGSRQSTLSFGFNT